MIETRLDFCFVSGSFTVITAIAYIALALTSFFSTTVSSTASSTGSQSFSVGFCYPFCWVAGVGLIIAGALQVSAANPDTVVVSLLLLFVELCPSVLEFFVR